MSSSGEALKRTVFQLISHHQDLPALLQESVDLNKNRANTEASIFDSSCLSLLQSKSSLTGVSAGFHGADQCAVRLLSIVGSSQEQMLAQTQKEDVEVVVNMIKQFIMENTFHRTRFYSVLCKEKSLALELIWILHREGIFSLQSYISFKQSDPDFLSQLSSQMLQLDDTVLLSGILGVLMKMRFTEEKETSDAKLLGSTAGTVIDSVTIGFLESLLKEDPPVCRFAGSLLSQQVTMDTLQRCFTHIITLTLSYNPVLKVSQAVKQQSQWKYGKTSDSLIDFYKYWSKEHTTDHQPMCRSWAQALARVYLWKSLLVEDNVYLDVALNGAGNDVEPKSNSDGFVIQLLVPFEASNVAEILHHVLETQEINWQLLLTFVSTCVVYVDHMPTVLSEFVQKLLTDGLESGDMESTITGLLLARQACSEGPHVFPSYADWFQRVFGEGSKTPANSRKSFMFLMKLLTDLVPFEAPQYLKVHILRPPFVPAKCRNLLNDYITLAKTRLTDMKEDVTGLYEDTAKQSDHKKVLEQTEHDIERALSSFQSTGKLPSFVMEASIFRKPYYLGRFLPTLLKPRPLPDVPDTRMKFIEALKKSEKIPSNLYTNYIKACKQEAAQLLEGVFTVDASDDDIDEMLMEPLEQLQHYLNLLTTVVTVPVEDKPKKTVSEVVSLIKEKMEAVVPEKTEVMVEDTAPLDLTHPDIQQKTLQVVNSILECITRTVFSVYQSGPPDFTWLHSLMLVIAEFPSLHAALFWRVSKLLLEQGPSLEDHHVDGLASFVCEVHSLVHQFPRILNFNLGRNCVNLHQSDETLFEHIFSNMSFKSSDWMTFSLRFLASCFKFIFSTNQASARDHHHMYTTAVHRMCFLCQRLLPEVRQSHHIDSDAHFDSCYVPERALVANMFLSKNFQAMLEKSQFSVKIWLEMEIQVNPERDILTCSARYNYYHWIIYQYFMSMPIQDGGCCHDYRLAATIVLQALMSHELKCDKKVPVHCSKCASIQSDIDLCNRNSLITLLQELCQCMCQQADIEDSGGSPEKPLWLLSNLQEVLQFQDITGDVQSDTNTQAIVPAFFRICQCLPAYLLFCDNLARPVVSDSQLLDTASHLNDLFVKYMSCGCYLPESLTAYIFQGILSVYSVCKDWGSGFDSFIKQCPIWFISSMVHFDQMQSWRNRVQAIGKLKILSKAGKAVKYISNVLSKESTTEVHQIKDTWTLSVALFSHLLHRNVGTKDDILDLCRTTFDKLPSSKQVLGTSANMMLCQLAYQELYAGSVNYRGLSDWLLGLMNFDYTLLFPEEGCDSQVQKYMYVKTSILNWKPVTLLRLLCKHVSPQVIHAENRSSSLGAIVSAFASVVKLFESINSHSKDKQRVQYSEPLTISDVLQMSKFVKSCVTEAPVHILQKLDQSTLAICGLEILQAVQHKLQCHR